MNSPMWHQTRATAVGARFHWVLALMALSLAFCHSTTTVDGGSGFIILNDDSGPPRQHHDAGMDAGDGSPGITITAMDASVDVRSLSPSRGPVAGGTPVTILGGGFLSGATPSDPSLAAAATSVTFGGNPVLSVLVLSDTELQVSSPPSQAGVVGPIDVTVANANGDAGCPGCYDYLTTIEIDSVSPGNGPLQGGTDITVVGIGFDSKTVLTVGGRGAIETTTVSVNEITAKTPPGSLPGQADVRAFNQNGSSLLFGAFTYLASPVSDSLDPVLGPVAGGTSVTLTGSGFLGQQVSVTVGGSSASQVQVLDDATVTFLTPPGSPGPADVTASDSNGTSTLRGGFVYYDPNATSFDLLGVVPSSGPVTGSPSVSLVGTGFPTGGFGVAFGAAAPDLATGSSANLATVAVPPGAPGPVAVVADAGGMISTLAAGYTYLPDRSVTSITPASGPSGGGTSVTITGAGFSATDQVFIGPLPAIATYVDPTTFTATTPPGSAGPNDVLVLNSSGGNPALLPAGFTYLDPLSLVQLAPTSGAQAGGTYVELLGTGFGLGDTATFGTSPATDIQLLDGFTLGCYSPPGTPGPVDVTVTAPQSGGQSTLMGGFSYYDPGSSAGGQSGGPLDGTLNVTVLSEYNGAAIPGATVELGLDPQTLFQGLTDANGQITFSDPTLVKAQTVTVSFEGTAVTIDGVTQQDLTVLLPIFLGSGNAPTPCFCSKNGQPPDCPNNCGVPYCTAMGTCAQCLQDSDCTNPNLPGYDPTKPHCYPPGGAGGSCVHCVADSDCANDPVAVDAGNLACDDERGTESTFQCVQCTSNTFCTGTQYCNTQIVTCENADVISGSIFGFKPDPNIVLTPTQDYEAHVGLFQQSVYYFEPFEPNAVTEYPVYNEGGSFAFEIDENQLDVSLYAKYGIEDSSTGIFTPLLLGLARGIEVDPDHPATGISILLDTHLDQSAPIRVQNQLSQPPGATPEIDGGFNTNGNPVLYDTFSYLDLGADGVVPLSDVISQSQNATLGSLPPIQGNGVLFLTQAFQNPPFPETFMDPSQRTPFSVFFRQVDTDFTQGVQTGPLLPFVQPIHPASGAALDGTFQWSFAGSTPAVGSPDLTEIEVAYVIVYSEGTQTFETSPQVLWTIVVPGSQTQVQIPTAPLSQILTEVPQSSPGFEVFLFWVIDTAQAPRFNYSFFSYTDLSPQSWTSFQSTQQLTAP